MLTAPQLKTLLREHQLRLTKRLGQHHLVDAAAIRRIIEACQLSPDETVVEIGAGLGALTEPLAAQAGRVIAVEIDRRIAALLNDRMRSLPNVEIRHGDILEFPWAEAAGATVVGAIPYHITSPIIVALSEQRGALRQAVLVLQDEVAARLLAAPGTKAYGRLSVLAQYAWELSSRFTVPRSAFFPQPDVDSRCIRLLPRTKPAVQVQDEALFFDLVKRAFAHRRKTLVNCLSDPGGVSRAQAEAAIRALGWPASIRGEALSLEQFAQLAKILAGGCRGADPAQREDPHRAEGPASGTAQRQDPPATVR